MQNEAAKTPEQRIHSFKLLDFIQKTSLEFGHSLETHIVKISLRSSEGCLSLGNLQLFIGYAYSRLEQAR